MGPLLFLWVLLKRTNCQHTSVQNIFTNIAVTQRAGLNLAFVPEKEKEMYPQNCTGVQVTNKAYISINSCSNDFKFCMLLNLTKLYEPNNKNMEKNKPNQSKPNQFSFNPTRTTQKKKFTLTQDPGPPGPGCEI